MATVSVGLFARRPAVIRIQSQPQEQVPANAQQTTGDDPLNKTQTAIGNMIPQLEHQISLLLGIYRM